MLQLSKFVRSSRHSALAITGFFSLLVMSLASPIGTHITFASDDEPTVRAQVGCGVRVYMTASGSSGTDASNDLATKASLENGTDLCVTVGVQYKDLSTVSASATPANYDVLYLQGQNNWGSSDLNAFLAADYAVIDAFISAGAGVVIGEWLAWDACAMSFAGAWGSLDAIMPATIRTNCDYGSNMKVRFYRWERPTSALLDTGVSSDFIFEPTDYAGSLSFMTLKTGAIPYYWATWDANRANVPAATDPANLPSAGGVGMAGWVAPGKSGRVFSFSTTNGSVELADTSSANAFRRLLINSLGWAGSVGGSITPDAVSATGSVGTSFSTPAMTPTKIVGSVSYSITNGTLPTGLALNPTNGSITGTPTSGGNIALTIQAVGSTSGIATATVALNIAGGQSATTTTPPTTPTTTTTLPTPTSTTVPAGTSSLSNATTIASSTTSTPATANVSLTRANNLPAAGTDIGLGRIALLLLAIGIATSVTRRRLMD